MLLSNGEICGDHLGAQLASGDLRNPSQLLERFGRVAEQRLYLGGPEVSRVNPDNDVSRLHCCAGLVLDRVDYADLIQPFTVKAQCDAKFGRTPPYEVANRMLGSGRDNKILGFFLLEYQPLQTNIISGVAPVTECVQVAYIEAILQALGDIG